MDVIEGVDRHGRAPRLTRCANLITVLKIRAVLPAAARKTGEYRRYEDRRFEDRRCEDRRYEDRRYEDRRYEDRRCEGGRYEDRRRAKEETADTGRATCPGMQVPLEAGKGKKETPRFSSRLCYRSS